MFTDNFCLGEDVAIHIDELERLLEGDCKMTHLSYGTSTVEARDGGRIHVETSCSEGVILIIREVSH